MVLFARQYPFFIPLRDVKHAVYLPVEEKLFGFVEAPGIVSYVGFRRGVEHPGQFPARRGIVQVHYGDGEVAYHLGSVDQRIQGAVDQHRPEQDQHGSSVLENGDELGFRYFPELFHGISLSRNIAGSSRPF